MNVILIGYRGTGKSTVARYLAGRLGWEWIDADVELELRAGKSIHSIFADAGEEAFRDQESSVLKDLAARERIVLAAGGGVILRPANRQVLSGTGPVVWLKAEPATILARLAADESTLGRRPRLTSADPAAEVVQLLAVRTPLYRGCASLEIDTEGKPPDQIAREIHERLRPILTPRTEHA